MTNDTILLKASKRTELGKAARRLRNDGIVPANMYERGKESVAISAAFGEITKVYNEAGKHHPVELDIDGKKYLTMIKDVDIDPVKGRVRHIAFHAVNRNETVEAEVPVRIDGEIPAERASLMVLHTLDNVEVEALPANLPDELLIDGSTLVEVGDKVTVADIKVPQNVTILTEPEQTVAVVEEPADRVAEAAAAAAELAEQNESEVPADNGQVESSEEAAEKTEE